MGTCAEVAANASCEAYHQNSRRTSLLQDFLLTDFNTDFHDDASLGRIQAGCTLHAMFGANKRCLLPTKVTHASPFLYLHVHIAHYFLSNQQKLMPYLTCIVLGIAGAYQLLSASKDSYHGRRLRVLCSAGIASACTLACILHEPAQHSIHAFHC